VRSDARHLLIPGVALTVALLLGGGCSLLRPAPEEVPISASEQLMIRADEAWQTRDFTEAARLYGMVTESVADDPQRDEALLRLALMEVVLPGDGPDTAAARKRLAAMSPESMSAGHAAIREALLELLGLYEGSHEAVRMLLEQNRKLEAKLAGRETEAIHQKASLYQWRKDVGRATQRAERLEMELEALRQEIKLLKEIDMMLQTGDGDTTPPAGDDQ